MIVVETRKDIVPATRLVPPRQDGESPVDARRRRARQLEEARHQPPVEVTTVLHLELGSTPIYFEDQEEPVIVWDMPQHTCCAKPDTTGRLFPRCGMTAWECAEQDWF